MEKNQLLKKAVVVEGRVDKHLGFVKEQISTLLSNTTWYEINFFNLFEEGHKTYVVEIEGEPVSFCSFIIENGVADVDATATKQGFQNMGLGFLCFKKALSDLKNDKIHTVLLEVAANNENAIKFYQKLGFTFQNRILPSYYNDGQNALIYGLSLID